MRHIEIAYPGAGVYNGGMSKLGLFKELFLFLRETKRWWLAPILIILILLGILIVLTESSAVLPFIYTLF